MNKLRQIAAHGQRGQSIVEYMVVCAALVAALFVPIQDDPASPGSKRSTIKIVLDAFHDAYRKISYSISLPN
jgi:hypothetical protein